METEKALVERVEVAKVVEVLVEKPIYNVDHCDCQKPEAVQFNVDKPIYK